MAKLGNNGIVTTEAKKICDAMKCMLDDIAEIITDEE